MKVLHILDSLNRGGAETLALDVCRNAGSNGLDMTFVATGGGDLEEEFSRSGAGYVRLQRRLPIDPQLIASLRKIIAERGIQVAHSYQAVDALHVYFATLGTGVKRVLSFQGYVTDIKNLTTLKFLIPRMDANVAVSEAFLKWLGTAAKLDTGRNFSIIYNGVDPKRLEHASGDNYLRSELSLSRDHILLGMVANFNPWKDQLTVCKALPRLFDHVPEAHFAFIGGRSPATPQLYDECVRYCRQHSITDHVHFLGKRRDIPELLGSLDIFVLSSLVEGLPVALVEAMMMGIPSVVSDIPSSREAVGGDGYALMFATGNADDLAKHLVTLTGSLEKRLSLADAARPLAMERFSIETHVRALSNLYGEILCK